MKFISQKALSLLLSITMLICMLPVGELAASAEVLESGFVDSSIADGGAGTPDDPYLISTAVQLQNVNKNLTASFKLTQDIPDAGNITPIGNYSTPFTGTFDGNNQKITVNITSTDPYVGLFRVIGKNGTVKNLTFVGTVKCSGKSNNIGILAGLNKGTVTNCSAETVDVQGVRDTSIDAQVFIGGLVGYNCSVIRDCAVMAGNVSGSATTGKSTICVGGLAGHNIGEISGCDSAATVNGDTTASAGARISAGGVIGDADSGSIVTDCQAKGNVMGKSTDGTLYIGGFVGFNQYNFRIEGCSAEGNVEAVSTGNSSIGYVGGFAGFSAGVLKSCHAGGTVRAQSGLQTTAGGFVGANSYVTKDCYSKGNVVGGAKTVAVVGGFAGFSAENGSAISDITGCYSEGSATVEEGGNHGRAGGFIGQNQNGSIGDCHATGEVKVTQNLLVKAGGFVGVNIKGITEKTTISNSYSTGNVTGIAQGNAADKTDSRVGGFAGLNSTDGVITNCYSTGGAAGNALGTVTATAIGGFAGTNINAIEGCYAAGNVTGTNTASKLSDVLDIGTSSFRADVPSGSAVSVGGFAALNTSTGTISKSYFDKQTSGQTESVGENYNNTAGSVSATGLKAYEMTGTAPGMADFDFTATWKATGNTKQSWYYPQLVSAATLDSKTSLESVTLPIEITSFPDLSASDKIKYLEFGTADISSAKLPGTVKAIANGIYDFDAGVSGWTFGMTFPAALGDYDFEPELTGYTVAGGTALPRITVRVTSLLVTAFDPLPAGTAVQEVVNGTPKALLKLPGTLTAQLADKPVTLSGVTWSSAPEYNSSTAGTYTFTAVLPTGYAPANSVPLPTITVKVAQPVISSFGSLPTAITTQNVNYSTPVGSLNLPSSLEATVDGVNKTVSGITWSSSPQYDPLKVGSYTFTAVPPAGYALADGVTLPKITVNVKLQVISSFGSLPAATATQNVNYSTPVGSLNLPSSLEATVEGGNKTVSGITWSSSPQYDPLKVGSYTFTAVPPAGYTLADGVTLPKITVHVKLQIISSFGSLPAATTTQNVSNGTPKSSLKLPSSLEATVDGGNKTVSGITWTESPAYNPNTAETYTFTAVLPAGYAPANGVTLPTLTVTVAAKQKNNSGSQSTAPTETRKEQTETKVDTAANTAVVTTKPDSVITSADTAIITADVPTITVDNTNTPTNGSTVDTEKKAAVTINVPAQAIKEQLAAKKDVELTVTVPSDVARDTNANVALSINANKGILEAAKENLSDVTIRIKDAGTQQLAYSWTFKGEDLAKSKVPVTDVNIAMSVHLTTEVPKVNAITPDKTGMVLSFDHSGELPSVASVTISALEKGFKPGQTLYFYYYNPTTKQIESLGKDAYTVDAQGNVTVQISHCSDYVLLPNAARSLILDTKTYQMPLGGSYEIGVKRTDAKDTTVKVYSSTKGVADVVKLKNGNYRVTAKKYGLTYIMFDVYDKKGKLIVKSHASVRLTVKKGTVPNGDSRRQTAIF